MYCGYCAYIHCQGKAGAGSTEAGIYMQNRDPGEHRNRGAADTGGNPGADVVILAIDVKISGENRFKGKPVVRMSTEKAMKNTGAMLQSIEEALTKKKNGGN